MSKLLLPCLILAIAGVVAHAARDESSESTSLGLAVEAFNVTAQADNIGSTQPPLTEEEVIAAIRGWRRVATPGVTDEVYDQYQDIAETRELPDGATIHFKTRWIGYRGYSFTVWWVDLSIKTGEKTGYTFRIRDRKISSYKQ